MYENMECPYCEKGFEYCDDEPGHGKEEAECPNCGKKFMFERSYSIDYHTSKADCLNGGAPHAWKQYSSYDYDGRHLWKCKACTRGGYFPAGETP